MNVFLVKNADKQEVAVRKEVKEGLKEGVNGDERVKEGVIDLGQERVKEGVIDLGQERVK